MAYMPHAALQVSVVIDDVKLESDADPINLKPTVMFQTRLFNFSMKNTGLGAMNYKWSVQNLDGTVDASGLYTVSSQAYAARLNAPNHILSPHKQAAAQLICRKHCQAIFHFPGFPLLQREVNTLLRCAGQP